MITTDTGLGKRLVRIREKRGEIQKQTAITMSPIQNNITPDIKKRDIKTMTKQLLLY